MRIKLIFFLLLLTYIPTKAEFFRNINLNHGLSHLSVMSICQDELGRMWFGTKEGINIYDGEQIKSYKGWIRNNKDSLIWLGNDIRFIRKGKDNNMYFLSDFNLFQYDVRKEKFNQLTTGSSTKAYIVAEKYIWYIKKDSLYKREFTGGKIYALKKSPDKNITCMELMSDSSLYIGTSTGLFYINRQNNIEYKQLLKDTDIFSIFESSKKEILIGTRTNGIFRKDSTGIFHKINNEHIQNNLNDSQIREFTEDLHGNIWFGTFSGLKKYNPETNEYSTVQVPQYIGGLSHPSIFSLYTDRNGTIWVGSYYGGVDYFNPYKNDFLHYNYQALTKKAAYFSYIGDMVEDKNENLWISTDGGGISCVDKDWNLIEQITATPNNGLPHNNIKSMVYDNNNHALFIGTYMGGLCRYDIYNKKFHFYKNLPSKIIYHIKKWNDNLYFSTPGGIYMLNPKTGEHKIISSRITFCESFDIDNKGNIYAERNHSIQYINLKNKNRFYNIHINTKGEINCICTTDKGLYICTLGDGLFYYEYKSKKIIRYNKANSHIPSDFCYNIKQVDALSFVLTTDNGVSLFTPTEKRLSTKTLNPENSLIRGCGIYVSENNNIYIGDTKGVSVFPKTAFYNSNELKGELYFSELSVNNSKIAPLDENNILKESLPFTKEINLKYFQNNFVIRFSHSDHKNYNNKHTFEYKLNGFDNRWTETTSNEIRYTNVNPGNYVLYVRPQESPDKAVSLFINISLPWYKKWWAISLYIIISISAITYFIRNRIAKRILSISLEKERFEKQHIEQVNHEKLMFFTNVSHEFRTPLTLIINHLDSLMKNQLPVQIYNNILKAKKNAQYMNNLVTELLDFRKFTQSQVTLHLAETNINSFIEEIYQSFTDYAKFRNIDFIFECKEDNIKCWIDRKQIEKVFFNLLSNAFKYTPNGKSISVTVSQNNKSTIVEVKDTGAGIAEDELPHIFERFFQGKTTNSTSGSYSTGIGLALTKTIIETHHGHIEVKSKVKEGSVFTVYIPNEKNEFEKDYNIEFISETSFKEGETHSNSSEYLLIPDIPEPDDNAIIKENDNNNSKTDKKYTILIVEDNPELLQVLEQIFSPFYNVRTATNGKEGLSAVYEFKPDIIISDIMMPEMNGTEMCLNIKNNIDLCHIPVILLTALNSEEQNIEGLNRGADDYITKPFNSRILLARTNNLLRNRLLIQHKINKQPISEVDLTSINPLDQKFLHKVTEIIEKHVSDVDFDIPQLCTEICMGRTLLYSKFKALTGMTPNNFLLNYRLKYAATMLKKYPTLQVAEISYRSGFNTPIYFSRCFKNQYGQTPQSYRRNAENTEL